MGKFIHVFDETTDNKVLSFFHSFNNALFKDLCEFDKTLQNKELSFFSSIHSTIHYLRKKKSSLTYVFQQYILAFNSCKSAGWGKRLKGQI